MSTICTFNDTENKHHLYCREDCMKRFCISSREHKKYIINFGKTKMS